MKFLYNCYLTLTGFSVWLVSLLLAMIILYPISIFANDGLSLPDSNQLIEAINQRHWPLVVAISITFGIWFLRYVIKDDLPVKYIPYITLGSTALLGAATGIIQAAQINHTWWIGMLQGLLEGITVGLSAMGVWSAGGKKLLPTIHKK